MLEKAELEVRDMEADLSAKEMLLVLGKVVYGAEQWATLDTKIKNLHPVGQPAEYKRWDVSKEPPCKPNTCKMLESVLWDSPRWYPSFSGNPDNHRVVSI